MKKTVKILSVLLILVIAFSIGNTCFARMTQYDDEESITLDSSKMETEKLVKSTEVEIKPNKPIIDFKLIIAAIVIVIIIAIIIMALVIKKNKQKNK